MAKHKKKRAHKVSKGLRPSIKSYTTRMVREERSVVDKHENKVSAWMKGKKGFVTIANPDRTQTNRLFIRVPFNTAFGGSFKDLKARTKRAEDKNRIEL